MSTIKSSAENLTLNADGANNDVIIQSNGSTKVTVDGQNSRVGIGTTSPTQPLHVAGNIYTTGYLNTAGSGTAGGVQFADGNLYMYRATNDLAVKLQGAEKLRIQSGGGISFNGDTAAANALDDYEEGTWTPTFSNNHIGSHTLNYANYVKVGRLVTINMYVYNFASIGGTGISFGITSLPFTQNVQALGAVTATHTNFHDSYGHAVARLYNGVAYIEQTKDAASGHWLDYSAFNGNSHVQMSITYETNS